MQSLAIPMSSLLVLHKYACFRVYILHRLSTQKPPSTAYDNKQLIACDNRVIYFIPWAYMGTRISYTQSKKRKKTPWKTGSSNCMDREGRKRLVELLAAGQAPQAGTALYSALLEGNLMPVSAVHNCRERPAKRARGAGRQRKTQ